MSFPPDSSDAKSKSNFDNTSILTIHDVLAKIDTFLDGFSLDGEELPVNNKSDNGDTLKSFDDFKGNIQNELSVSENLVVNESASKKQSTEVTFVGEMPAVYKHNSNEHNENLIYKTLPPDEHIKQEIKTESIDDESIPTDDTDKVKSFSFSLDKDKTINTKFGHPESYNQYNYSKPKSESPQYRNWNYQKNNNKKPNQPGLLNEWRPYIKSQKVFPNGLRKTFTDEPQEFSSIKWDRPRIDYPWLKRGTAGKYKFGFRKPFTKNVNDSQIMMNNISSSFNHNFKSRPYFNNFARPLVQPILKNTFPQNGSFIRPQCSSSLLAPKLKQQNVNTHLMCQKHTQNSACEHADSPVSIFKPNISDINLNRTDIEMQKSSESNQNKVYFPLQTSNNIFKSFISPVSLYGRTIKFISKRMVNTQTRETIINELSAYGSMNSWWTPDDQFYVTFASINVAKHIMFNICLAN